MQESSEIIAGKEYNLEFNEKGTWEMCFNCFCGNKYDFQIKEYDNGDITLKIDVLGMDKKN